MYRLRKKGQAVNECELCQPGPPALIESPDWRIIRVNDLDYPGFCRVIWKAHVVEMTDLTEAAQTGLMQVVFTVEQVVRSLFKADKINLASFGNVVPHVHWHIIPRWRDDKHFPQPIWGQAQRATGSERIAISDNQLREVLLQALQEKRLI